MTNDERLTRCWAPREHDLTLRGNGPAPLLSFASSACVRLFSVLRVWELGLLSSHASLGSACCAADPGRR
jgi:hypothetical protein